MTAAALTVLKAVAARFSHDFVLSEWPIGAVAMRTKGVPLPEETLAACRDADAVLMGAVGDPAYDLAPRDKRPEAGLLAIRKALGLYANIRPARVYKGLEARRPAQAGDRPRHRPRRRARADGRALLRDPARAGSRGGNGREHAAVHAARGRAHRRGGVPPRGGPPEEGHVRRQVQRPRDLAALARGRDRGRRSGIRTSSSSTSSSTRAR